MKALREFAPWIVLFAVGAGLAAIAWHVPGDTATKAPIVDAEPTDNDIRREVVNKAIEYASMLISPRLSRPESAKYPRDKVRIERTGTFRNVERWSGTGIVEYTAADGARIVQPWEVSLAFFDGRFAPLHVDLEGERVAEPDSPPARIIHEVEDGN